MNEKKRELLAWLDCCDGPQGKGKLVCQQLNLELLRAGNGSIGVVFHALVDGFDLSKGLVVTKLP